MADLSLFTNPQVGQLSQPQQLPLGPMPGAMNAFPNAGANSVPGSMPTTDPQEVETRKSGWRVFVDRLKTDKALQQALLAFGAQAMQPIPATGTAAGQFGKAALAGGQAYSQQQALEGRQQYLNRLVGAQEITAAATKSRAGTAERAQSLAERQQAAAEPLAERKQTQAEREGESLIRYRDAMAKYYGARAQRPYADSTAAAVQLRQSIAEDIHSKNPDIPMYQARLMADEQIASVPLDKFVQGAQAAAARDADITIAVHNAQVKQSGQGQLWTRDYYMKTVVPEEATAAWIASQRAKGQYGAGAGRTTPGTAPPTTRRYNPETGLIE